jgi:hypothetical protein
LLPVSDGYTKVTITGSQVTLPHLPELISPEENHQLLFDEARTHLTLATLETIARRSSPTKQRSYVELRDLLATISSEETTSNQTTLVYALITFSIILSFVVLTSRPFLTLFHKIFPWQNVRRPSLDLGMTRLSTHPVVMSPDTTDFPCCIDTSEELTSHPATPLQMEADQDLLYNPDQWSEHASRD